MQLYILQKMKKEAHFWFLIKSYSHTSGHNAIPTTWWQASHSWNVHEWQEKEKQCVAVQNTQKSKAGLHCEICSCCVVTSCRTHQHAPPAVNNHCFTVLRKAEIMFCVEITRRAIVAALDKWNRGALEPSKWWCLPWSEVKEEGGEQVPQKSGSGCSTLAAHHGSSQVNVKTRESFAEYWFNAAAWA